jgi:hypothetical protein
MCAAKRSVVESVRRSPVLTPPAPAGARMSAPPVEARMIPRRFSRLGRARQSKVSDDGDERRRHPSDEGGLGRRGVEQPRRLHHEPDADERAQEAARAPCVAGSAEDPPGKERREEERRQRHPHREVRERRPVVEHAARDGEGRAPDDRRQQYRAVRGEIRLELH